ncbi:MAG: hypothetical protein QG575_632 [Euryarchaeota archaeon]|nr:hypothetical protein [Euryarchaeota archaeon]
MDTKNELGLILLMLVLLILLRLFTGTDNMLMP